MVFVKITARDRESFVIFEGQKYTDFVTLLKSSNTKPQKTPKTNYLQKTPSDNISFNICIAKLFGIW